MKLLDILLLGILSALSASAQVTYYVAPYGNDSADGSGNTPFRTLARGVRSAGPGDTVLVRDGTYGHEQTVTEGDDITTNRSPVILRNSGKPSAWITIKAEHRWGAILDCELLCDSYINLLNASYIVIQDFVFTRGFKEGIHSNDAAHHIVIRGNRIENIGNRVASTPLGIGGMYTNPNCHDFVIDGNLFNDIGRTNPVALDHGLYLHGSNFTIINNGFFNIPHGWSIQMADGLSHALVANNTFAFANADDGQIMLWNNLSDIKIQNNIFYNPNNTAIARYQARLDGCIIDHNMVYGAGSVMTGAGGCTLGVNQLGTNPMFVNPYSAPFDLHLQAGSPAIGAGTDVAAVAADILGNPRSGSGIDLGAVQFTPPIFATRLPIISGVAVSAIGVDAATIAWTTDVPATTALRYGPDAYMALTPQDPALLLAHVVMLTGLKPSTQYHFRISSRDAAGNLAASDDFTFTTADLPLFPQ